MSLILSGTDGLSDVDGSAATPAIRGTDANTGIFFPAADTIAFAEGGAEAMRLDSAGNMGLGVTPSAWFASNKAFQIGSTGCLSNYTNGANIQTFLANNVYWNAAGTISYLTTNTATSYTQDNGAHKWYYAASGTAGNAITFTQAMTLDASGRLGIGTTNIQERLTVQDNIQITNSASNLSGIYFGTNANPGQRFSYIESDGRSTGYISLNTNATERARIDSSGNLLVGTTSSSLSAANRGVIEVNGTTDTALGFKSSNSLKGFIYASATEFRLDASAIPITFDISSSEKARIDSSGNLLVGQTTAYSGIGGITIVPLASGANTCAVVSWNKSTTGGDAAAQFRHSNSVVGSISYTNTAVTYATSSDYRLKNTIAPMTGALAKVALLKPVNYKWNIDGSDSQGFIAHELQAVVPECVTGEKDAVDAEGNPKYQGVDTSYLVATLTAAIQEQQALITTLTARITALESA